MDVATNSVISDSELDGLLAAADPLRGRIEAVPTLSATSDLLASLTRGSAGRWPVRHRRGAALLSGLVLVAAGTGAAAAAGVFSPDDRTVVTSPDFRTDVLPTLTPSLPLPSGVTWAKLDDFYAARWQRAFGPGEVAEYDRGAVARDLENLAACAWDRTWIAAHARGDHLAETQAATQITAAPHWQFIARYHDGITSSRVVIASAVGRGDLRAMQRESATICPTDLP